MREKIPLYLNGTLPEAELRDVEEFISQSQEAHAEMNEFLRIKNYLRDTGAAELPDSEVIFFRIMQKVRRHESPKPGGERAFHKRIRDLFSAPLLPWALVATEFLLIIFLVISPYRDHGYFTLTSPVPERGSMVNIVFTPDAREMEIRRILESVNATIVSGPYDNGLYVIKIEDSDIEKALDILKSSGLVRFAEERI